MNIKFIKLLTEDHRIKHVLSFFWDYELKFPETDETAYIYRDVLSQQDSFESIYDVFELIKCTFFTYPCKNKKGWNRHKEIENMKDFSELLFDDRQYWKIGTELERQKTVPDEKLKDILENYHKLQFLYEVLELRVKKHRKNDFVYSVSRIDDLSFEIIMASQAESLSKESVFTICEKYALSSLNTRTLSWPIYYIMGSISYFAYGDNKYWMTKNQLDFNEITAHMKHRATVESNPDKRDESVF